MLCVLWEISPVFGYAYFCTCHQGFYFCLFLFFLFAAFPRSRHPIQNSISVIRWVYPCNWLQILENCGPITGIWDWIYGPIRKKIFRYMQPRRDILFMWAFVRKVLAGLLLLIIPTGFLHSMPTSIISFPNWRNM